MTDWTKPVYRVSDNRLCRVLVIDRKSCQNKRVVLLVLDTSHDQDEVDVVQPTSSSYKNSDPWTKESVFKTEIVYAERNGDGRKTRLICTDRKSKRNSSFVVLVERPGGNDEDIIHMTKDRFKKEFTVLKTPIDWTKPVRTVQGHHSVQVLLTSSILKGDKVNSNSPVSVLIDTPDCKLVAFYRQDGSPSCRNTEIMDVQLSDIPELENLPEKLTANVYFYKDGSVTTSKNPLLPIIGDENVIASAKVTVEVGQFTAQLPTAQYMSSICKN